MSKIILKDFKVNADQFWTDTVKPYVEKFNVLDVSTHAEIDSLWAKVSKEIKENSTLSEDMLNKALSIYFVTLHSTLDEKKGKAEEQSFDADLATILSNKAAQAIHDEMKQRYIERAIDSIKRACQQGDDIVKIDVSAEHKKELVKYLKSKGFRVKMFSWFIDYRITVKWDKN